MVCRTSLVDGAERVIEGSRTRLTVLGIVVMVLFSALFTRLWFLQVAESTSYTAAATENRVRVIYEPALRGRILDAGRRPLVENRAIDVLTFDRSARITDQQRRTTIGRLAALLGVTEKEINKRIDNKQVSPYAPIPIETNVKPEVRTYVEEHRPEFPAVDVRRTAIRYYPNNEIAAHLLGYVGEINERELKARKHEGYRPGDLIGKDGVEEMFESVLRGRPRRLKLAVDNLGRVVRTIEDRPAVPGKDVQLTINLDTQRVAEDSLNQGMDGAKGFQNVGERGRFERFRSGAGSVVVLDAHDGSVVAMASKPSYNPNDLANGISPQEFGALKDEAGNAPLINRSIQGLYAPGSTFKLITSVAALEQQLVDPGFVYYDRGYVDVGDPPTRFNNAGEKEWGSVDLAGAIEVSSDSYFYELGRDMWQHYNVWKDANEDGLPEPEGAIAKGYAIQDTARKFGFGEPTGIGLPGEQGGRVPDQQWKEEFNRNEPNPRLRVERSLWLPGDNVNLAVGQGDLVVTPLQLASAYLAFADGGTLFTPRLAQAILEPGTEPTEEPTVFRELPPQAVKKIEIASEVRIPIMDGLVRVVSGGRGTARGAFSDYVSGSVAGKTGTAENTPPKQDTSLFVGITNPSEPAHVVTTVVEEAGFGSAVAAPITRRVIDQLNGNNEPPPVVVRPPDPEND
jgi:penicillin-binding protein 2